jgi:FtsZ-interacting cell division protein ZipA
MGISVNAVKLKWNMSNKGVSRMGDQKLMKKAIVWGLIAVETIATITVCLIGSRTFGHNYKTSTASSVKVSKITIKDKENVVESKTEKNVMPEVKDDTKAESPAAVQDTKQKSSATTSPSNTTTKVQQTTNSKAVSKTTQKSTGSQQPAEQTPQAQGQGTSTETVPPSPTTSPTPAPQTPTPEPTVPNVDQTPVTDPAAGNSNQGETAPGNTSPTP